MNAFSKMVSSFQSEAKSIYKNGIELMYYMRGALSKNEMLELTAYERDIITEFIKERLEQEKQKIKNLPSAHMVY